MSIKFCILLCFLGIDKTNKIFRSDVFVICYTHCVPLSNHSVAVAIANA